jgi:hypothetical protein
MELDLMSIRSGRMIARLEQGWSSAGRLEVWTLSVRLFDQITRVSFRFETQIPSHVIADN